MLSGAESDMVPSDKRERANVREGMAQGPIKIPAVLLSTIISVTNHRRHNIL